MEQDLQVQNSMGPNTMLSPMSLRQHTHRHLNDNAKVAIEDAPQNEEKKKKQPDQHEIVVVKEAAENYLGIRSKFMVHFVMLKFMDLDLSYAFNLCDRVLT